MSNTNFHFFITHKGGVGKSWSCTQFATYAQDNLEAPIMCYDCDPQNPSLSKFSGFPVKKLPLLDLETNAVDLSNFDALIDNEVPFILSENIQHVLLDFGSSSFKELLLYLVQNPIIPMLQVYGNVYVHAVLNGGQAYEETILSLEKMIKVFNTVSFVIWENKHVAGKVANSEGIHFLDDPLYQNIISKAYKVHHIVIPCLNKDTYGKDLELLAARNLTVKQAQKDERYATSIMTKQRLLNFQRILFTEITKAGFLEEETSE